MTNSITPPTVHILLATYQGAEYLQEQLESIACQTHKNWTLTVSDDGSTDGTLGIIRNFADRMDQLVTLLRGPGKGATANFFHLINAVNADTPDDLFSFCDQDDVWLPEKLSRAVYYHVHQEAPSCQPLMYCGRTQLVDASLSPQGLSKVPRRPLGFGNALLQNVASGNTMVLNTSLLRLLKQIDPAHSVWHDWSAYQAATGCGGVVHYDPMPCLLYRQHHANVIGATEGFLARLKRLRLILHGRYKQWGDQTEAAMADIGHHLSPAAMKQLEVFRQMRRCPDGLQRLRAGWSSGLWRQSPSGQAGLLVGLYLGLI